MNPLSDWPRSRRGKGRDAAVVVNPVVDSIHRYWQGRTCPFCGKPTGDMWSLRVLSTYTLCCEVCGEVVESFELYQDYTGHYYTENHRRAVRFDPGTGDVEWRHIG